MTSRLPPEMSRLDKHPMRQDRNSSSDPAHKQPCLCLDKFRLKKSLADEYLSAELLLPESILGIWLIGLMPYIFSYYGFYSLFSFYPIPTHSKQSLIALLKTVSVSPRIAPKPSIIDPEISSTACDKAFFALVNSITPFIFWRHCSTSDIKFSLRTEI